MWCEPGKFRTQFSHICAKQKRLTTFHILSLFFSRTSFRSLLTNRKSLSTRPFRKDSNNQSYPLIKGQDVSNHSIQSESCCWAMTYLVCRWLCAVLSPHGFVLTCMCCDTKRKATNGAPHTTAMLWLGYSAQHIAQNRFQHHDHDH